MLYKPGTSAIGCLHQKTPVNGAIISNDKLECTIRKAQDLTVQRSKKTGEKNEERRKEVHKER